MRIKDYFKTFFLGIRRDKNKIFLIIIMIICTILSLGVLTFKNIFTTYVNDSINKNIGFRLIQVAPKFDSEDYGLSELKNVEHIVDVYSSQYDSIFLDSDFANSSYDGRIELLYGEKNSIPTNIIGDTFKEGQRNVAICPQKFYPDSSIYETKINEEKIIDGKSLIGKDFKVKYYSYVYEGEEQKIKEEFSKSFKIIGLYDSKNIMNLANQCYVPFEDIKEITDTMLLDDENQSIYAFSLVVDNSKNVNSVIETLDQMGFVGIRLKNQIDQKLVNTIIVSSDIVISLVLFSVILLVSSYTKKKILNEIKTIGVLRTIGYERKNVLLLYLLEIVMVNILSFALGAGIFSIVFLLLKEYVFNYLDYFGIILSLNIINYIYTFILIVVVSSIVAYYYINKKIKNNIVDLVRNEE